MIIVGLGNPGNEYDRTRHNLGFIVVDAIASHLELNWKHRSDLNASVIETVSNGKKIILAKPDTFMNNSGVSVAKIIHAFHLSASDLVVVHDDVSLPFGTIRIRKDGASGGHNGLKSIFSALGSQQVARLKIGVNPPPPMVPLEKYVLGHFSGEELKKLPDLISFCKDYLLSKPVNLISEETVKVFSQTEI